MAVANAPPRCLLLSRHIVPQQKVGAGVKEAAGKVDENQKKLAEVRGATSVYNAARLRFRRAGITVSVHLSVSAVCVGEEEV